MTSIKRVNTTALQKGMFVIDREKGQVLVPPIYSVEGYILSSEEGERLHKAGFLYAFIDPERSTSAADWDIEIDTENTEPISFYQTVSMQEEFVRAQQLHSQALESARALTEMVATGISESNVHHIQTILEESIESLKRNENALLSLIKLKAVDEYTFAHCVNVAILAVVLGRRLHVHERSLPDLAMAGFFHDIGKLLIPPEILNYPGKLFGKQMDIMRSHVQLGSLFLQNYPQIPMIVKIGAIEHHERHGGTGYPLQKKGDDISLVGKILAIVDVYDALSSKRCYKGALSPVTCLSILYKDKENEYATGFVEALIAALGVYPTGSLIKLSNSYLAVVTEQNDESPLKPKVVTLVDAFGDKVTHPKLLDLTVHRNISIVEPVITLPFKVDVEQAILYAR